MKAFQAIFKQTIRSAMRSKVFIVLGVLILLYVIGLPLTIKGDNTAAGLVQVSLTYSLNVVIALISASALWLGCSLISSEIENYNIHLLTTKPCPRWLYWLGKWCGVFVMHAVILAVSMLVIYALLMFYRLPAARRQGLFTDADLAKLDQEILTARRTFHPENPDWDGELLAEYDRRVQDGRINPNQDKIATLKALRGEVTQRLASNIVLKPGESVTWKFHNVTVLDNEVPLYLRFRIYTDGVRNTDQRMLPVDWGFGVYQGLDGKKVESLQRPFVWYSQGQGNFFVHPGGTWQELNTIALSRFKTQGDQVSLDGALKESEMPVPAAMIVEKESGDVELTLVNPNSVPDPSTIPDTQEAKDAYDKLVRTYTGVIQFADRPVLLCKVAGFFNNFMRTMLMAIFQLAFLTALGCTVGAVFSTPVAVFLALAYLVIGLLVPAAVDAPLKNDDGTYKYKSTIQRWDHYLAQTVQVMVVTVDDLDCTGDLAAGRLVERGTIVDTLVKVLFLRTGLMALVGIYVLHRRELGLVVRKL